MCHAAPQPGFLLTRIPSTDLLLGQGVLKSKGIVIYIINVLNCLVFMYFVKCNNTTVALILVSFCTISWVKLAHLTKPAHFKPETVVSTADNNFDNVQRLCFCVFVSFIAHLWSSVGVQTPFTKENRLSQLHCTKTMYSYLLNKHYILEESGEQSRTVQDLLPVPRFDSVPVSLEFAVYPKTSFLYSCSSFSFRCESE